MRRFAVFIALVTACVLAQGPAAAADIFGKFTDISGESQAEGRKDWIDVLSYSWGATNPGSFAFGGGGGAGKVTFQDFSFQKRVDKSSPVLFFDLASGKHIQEALFDVVKPGQDPQTFLKYKFSDVLVTSYSISGNDSVAVPVESWSLAFGKVEMTYREQQPDGKLGGPITVFWDLKDGKGGLNTAPIPEPSTWAMLIAGLAFVAFRGRRLVQSRAA